MAMLNFSDHDLCCSCPLRRIGMRIVTDIQPENGALSVVKLNRGKVLPADTFPRQFIVVRKGSLKVEYLHADGRPDVAAFLFAGEPVVSTFSEQPVAITALEDTVLCDLDPRRIQPVPGRRSAVMDECWQATGAQAAEDQRRLINARTGSVADRLRWFLADLAQRQASDTVILSMSREDIAHYLESSAESISRTLTELDREGSIVREKPRRIRIVG